MARDTPAHMSKMGRMGASRSTANKYDDHNLMQEVDVEVHHSETHTGIERPQPVGLTSVPLKRKGQQGQQQQGQQGAGGNGQQLNNNQPSGDAAEHFILYVGGDHSHPVAIATDDRRCRPYDMKEGETACYHATGSEQMVFMNDKGTHVVTLDGKDQKENSQSQTRYLFSGHVQKDMQSHKISSSGGQSGSSGGSSSSGGQQQQQDYKHYGKKWNMGHRYAQTRKETISNGNPETAGSDGIVNYYDSQKSEHFHTDKPGGQTTLTWNSSKIDHASQNIQHVAQQVMFQQANTHFVGGSSVMHIHGNIIAEPINLGHIQPTVAGAQFGFGDGVIRLGDVADSGMTMTTSTSSPTPPSVPELGVPYDGFRWIDTTSGIEYSYYSGVWAEGGGDVAFPVSPAINQTFTFPASPPNRTWMWNGVGWQSTTSARLDSAEASITALQAISNFFKHAGSDLTLLNQTAAQPIFVGYPDFTLEANTAYKFFGQVRMTWQSSSAVSGISFGGTVTMTTIWGRMDFPTGSSTSGGGADFQSAGGNTDPGLNNGAAIIRIHGSLRTGASAGTFRPQVTFSANPGTTRTVNAGTYFELSKLGANTYNGNA